MVMKKKTSKSLGELFFELINIDSSKSLNQVAHKWSDPCDHMIIKGKEESLIYVGGRLHLEVGLNDMFTVAVDMYFQDKKGQWINKHVDLDKQPTALLTDAARKDLYKQKCVTYEIDDLGVADD